MTIWGKSDIAKYIAMGIATERGIVPESIIVNIIAIVITMIAGITITETDTTEIDTTETEMHIVIMIDIVDIKPVHKLVTHLIITTT